MINKFMAYFVTLFDNMSTFHFLTDLIFMQSDIYELKSSMHNKVFSYSKYLSCSCLTIDGKYYSRTFYLATISEEIIVSEKIMLKLTLKYFKKLKT